MTLQNDTGVGSDSDVESFYDHGPREVNQEEEELNYEL